MTNFQIDYGSLPLTQPAAVKPLFASVNGRASSLANGEVVFFEPVSERPHVMTEQVLAAMDVCRPFRTLEEHIQALRKAMPPLAAQGDAVKRVLENLIARGLILSDADWLARLTQDSPPAQAEFAGFHIRACDRPAQLRCLLDSLLDYERRYAPRHRYVLLDDSRDSANAREQRRLFDEFAAVAGVEARYVGAEAWQRMADLLGRETERSELVDWLLRRMPERRQHGGGLAMNLIALLAAGRRYVLLDDDFVFPLRLHPETDGRVDLGAVPMQSRFFESVEDALAAGIEYDRDPMQDHLDACGASLGSLINKHPRMRVERADLRGLAPSRLPHLEAQRRIVATVNGHRGHSGAAEAGWLFLLDPTSRASFWAQRDSYLRHIESPTLWYGPRRSNVHAQGNFTPYMVDASLMVPYTSPTGRGEDRLFGALCRFAEPQSLTLHLPSAIGHRQERERGRAASLKEPYTPRFNAYLTELVLTSVSEFQASSPAARLRGLAARMRDLSWASDSAILGELREHQTYLRSNFIKQYQSVLTKAKNAPIYWQADLRQLIEANGKALTQFGVPRLADWDPSLDAAGCVALYREQLSRHADALEFWPQLFKFAADRGPRLIESLR